MTKIGYYNYYNDPSRYSPETVQDRYTQMVERYQSDELHCNNQNPYSEKNLAVRALDEKLASMAESLRSRFKNKEEVRQYLSQKYFGTSDFAYTKKWQEPEKYAMFENDLNAVLFGTVGGANLNDPRLNYTQKNWEEEELEEKTASQQAISNQMVNLLEKNDVFLNDTDTFLISFDPYSYDVSIKGVENNDLLLKITALLNSGNNSRELLYYTIQRSGNLDKDVLTKFRAWHQVKEYANLDLSTLPLKDGEYYTTDGEKLMDVINAAIKSDTSINSEFKGTASEYIKGLIDTVTQNGWNNIEDLNLSIGYSRNAGFFNIGQSYVA